ncbi:hypothetical protein [Halalkalibacter urbisdiaboli]|uniref:hypothetical protein n=1 Tax=Halalkalibacter urbisdiaboli TaxID=1960589 RepID=UPI0013FE2C21|nr:hypothetical protein [Halalkalibacter urbisdiaboli]
MIRLVERGIDILKTMFFDLVSMSKGFIYGFVMVGLFIIVVTVLLYGFLYLKNVFF